MALLDMQQQEAPEAMGAEQPGAEESGAGLTVSAEQISSEIMKQVEPNQQQALKQAVNAGMKILFDKETHSKVFDSIRPDDEVPLSDELGVGITNLMVVMYERSKGTMPAEIVVPVGAVLLAKAVEFISETGLAEVTDNDFSEAFEMFTVSIQDKLDPEFRQKNGLEGAQAEQPQQQEQPMQPQQPAQAGGLLNTGSMQ